MKNKEIIIDGIKYEVDKLSDLNYTLEKMNDYISKVGFEKSIRSQKFIRHLHICIALKLNKELNIPSESIHFEVKLKNKNIDIGIIEENEIKFAISIRSQSSSIKKNFTNNVNSLQGEVVSLKSSYPGLKVGVIYLLKKTDIDTKDDCWKYYEQMLPRKLLPLINTNIPTNDRFDAASIIIWDINEKTNKVELFSNIITQTYNIDTFMNDVKEIMSESKIKSQFSVSEMDEELLRKFLSSN